MNNTVIMTSEHRRSLRKHSRWHWLFHGLSALVILAVLAVPWMWKLDRDLLSEAQKWAKVRFAEVQAKQKILSILRSKSLSIGQGMDIADTILSQQEIPVSMVLAIMETESSFNPDAVSSHGARGLLQAMPLTAKTYAGNLSKNIHDPIVNVKASVAYLGDLKKTHGENWGKILRSFNGGPKNSDNKALDGYVRIVMARADEYQKQLGW